ncbi:MAG TPA: tetratricopeptide repeat protein [Thermoguttaceae bacterium]|nr:tetratricopeptide repeat protein [Thermoguttaceae bacterium]
MAAIAETLKTAVGEHRTGRLDRAEELYRRVLRADPGHADALHLLGVLAHQKGEHQAAVDMIRRAIAANPRIPPFFSNLGLAYAALHRLDDATASYRQALQLAPNYAEAHYNLGNVLKDQGRLDDAADCYRRAVQIKPDYAAAHNNLGTLWKTQGRLDDAAASYRRALQVCPDFAEAHANLGVVFQDRGEYDEAAACYRRALELQPDNPATLYDLGLALQNQEQLDEAIVAYERALQIRPDYAEAHSNLGAALQMQGRFDEAETHYRRALQINPDYAEAYSNLGAVLVAQSRHEEAAANYRQALRLSPSYAAAHNNLGHVLAAQGKLEEAAAGYRRALRIEPDHATWELRIATLYPPVFRSNDHIDEYRARLLADIERFSQRNLRIPLVEFSTCGSQPPFVLMYHGRNDRPIKAAYAGIFRHCFPEEGPPVGSGRPRVGFVVTDRHEGIFLQALRGLLQRINTELMEVVVVCSRGGLPKLSEAIRRESIRFLAMPERFDRIVETIREARFDLLYHWEVGTDAVNYFLPFCRLAAIQCTSAGIPATSGIPAMDYYLSHELWESDRSDQYYTETLVRTRTNLAYPHRVALPDSPKKRENFGFSAKEHLYLCAQRIEKFHPDFDTVLAGIVRRDSAARVVIVEDELGYAAAALRRRFEATIPDALDRIVFLPCQPFSDYLGLVAASDVLLDTMHYNGGTTTYQGFALGKPIVTLPTRLHAGRTVYACYRRMGITDCIAEDPEDYVEIAVRLGADADYRASVSGQIRAAGCLLFEDERAVRELEEIFLKLIAEARAR